jgi:hypothetical protein
MTNHGNSLKLLTGSLDWLDFADEGEATGVWLPIDMADMAEGYMAVDMADVLSEGAL